jgi:hypothetical protein
MFDEMKWGMVANNRVKGKVGQCRQLTGKGNHDMNQGGRRDGSGGELVRMKNGNRWVSRKWN